MSPMLRILGYLTEHRQGCCMSCCLWVRHCCLLQHAVPYAQQQASLGHLAGNPCRIVMLN